MSSACNVTWSLSTDADCAVRHAACNECAMNDADALRLATRALAERSIGYRRLHGTKMSYPER
ncbi:hypothetical protein XBLMG947_4008 [Xanthomonas bromi]|uniref:Uncharacterized protein n=1 Tax=Xanthomonas bromi TaxID=56449 RepID=A0A1C3NS78_9XANT|nr:hypothetical protein XBLMG947_4008 [Xanthomonas bromi]